ncbi:olfactory receptor 4E1-like [Scleropages formosus]|uniref:olfactory receptor 4E1-like n=1 Tax=Scleropages formosus TaxID=113540 RepID=UPI0010FA8CE9|nr:olfactory receptor 4E1-like [Scleropages formosus]
MENFSTVEFITLSGLQGLGGNRSIYFTLTLLTYLLIVSVNFTLISTIVIEKTLHEPMYIFLSNLCANSLYGTTGFYPKILLDLLSDVHVISYNLCLIQLYVIYSSLLCEIHILTVMAYDRYVAICRPLEYHTVMTPLTVKVMLFFSWCFPLFWCVFIVLSTFSLPLCGSHIDKLYCDNWSVVKLSCVPNTVNNVLGYIMITLEITQAFFTLYSYYCIVRVCLKSKEGRSKFMQTCLPHLVAIVNFMIANLFDVMYSRYGSDRLPLTLRNIMAVEFLVIPPLLNPIIYGLNLQKIRSTLINAVRCIR